MVIQKEDEQGKVGVKIGRELMNVAAMALKRNITSLGPLVLPVSEQLIFAGNFVARKVCAGLSAPHAPQPAAEATLILHPRQPSPMHPVLWNLKPSCLSLLHAHPSTLAPFKGGGIFTRTGRMLRYSKVQRTLKMARAAADLPSQTLKRPAQRSHDWQVCNLVS